MTNDNTKELYDKIKRLDKCGVAIATAYVKGIETGKLIYDKTEDRPTEDEPEKTEVIS